MSSAQAFRATPSWIERDHANSIHPWTDVDHRTEDELVSIVRAEGAYLFDSEGRRYLDAVGGLWCNNIGTGRDEIADAVAEQIRELSYSNTFTDLTHPLAIELSEKLASLAPSGLNHVMLTTGGSTAVDSAYRLCLYYQGCRGYSKKRHVIARRDAYHGSTYATSSLSGKPDDRQPEMPYITDTIHHIASPNDYRRPAGMEDLDEAAFVDALVRNFEAKIDELGGPDHVAAFFAEPVMGAGGVIVPPRNYLRRMADVCKRNDILFVADEVVTGFGRLGHFFASEDEFDIQPDIVTFAKGVTSGYIPLGGLVISGEIRDVLFETGHDRWLPIGFTYAGHPVACRAALKNIEIMEREGILEHVGAVGPYFEKKLATLLDLPIVGNVRGKKMMMCVEFVRDRESRAPFDDSLRIGKRVSNHADRAGLMVRPIGPLNVMSPALTIDHGEIDFIVDTLRKSIEVTMKDLKALGAL